MTETRPLEAPQAWPNFVEVPQLSQRRSVLALERFLAAGEQLLADNAFDEAGVAEVAEAAQSSVGTFYRIFADKETLLLLIVQRFFSEVIRKIDVLEAELPAQGDLRAYLENLVSTLVTIYAGRAGVLRATILRSSKSLAFRQNVHQLNDYLAASTQRCLGRYAGQITHPSRDKAGSLALHMLLGALNQHTITGSLGGTARDQLQDELLRLILAYLTFDPAAQATP